MRQGTVVDLQDVEVSLIVLSKRVLAGSEAEEEQHAIAEGICGVALPSITPTTRYQLLWCLPSTAATSCIVTMSLTLQRMNWQHVPAHDELVTYRASPVSEKNTNK